MSMTRVRVADYAVAHGDTAVLTTVGLGSCVAIILHDPAARVGALAHVLLPSEELSRDRSNPAKFPGTVVPLMLEEMASHGARDTGRITARLVGGASMFGSLMGSGSMNVGERNIIAAREALERAGVQVAAEDVGGDHGRTVYLHVADGRVEVRSIRKGTREL
jgi:chemotaxis protein CheD